MIINIKKEYDLIFSFLIKHFKKDLRRAILKNLTHLTLAFIELFSGIRSNYGGLTLATIARSMCIKMHFKHKYKKLNRFLDNKYLGPNSLSLIMINLALANYKEPYVTIIIDQTSRNDIQIVMAGIPYKGRCIPLGWVSFEYPLELKLISKNYLENLLIKWIQEIFPNHILPLFIMDRGYARVSHISALNKTNHPYIIRSPRNVLVDAVINGKRKKMMITRLRYKMGKACIYKNVLYHSSKKEKVNIVVYHKPKQQQPWYLIFPANYDIKFSAEDVLMLYKKRMQIEQGFRDWKTHLGLRKLNLQLRKAERILRLLM